MEPAHVPWTPASEEERGLVLRELEAILSSYHFRESKRYPALLRHVVEATLAARGGELKERTLGIDVFGRQPGYDTNSDPVVRISAAEVRKRIAQYYHENPAPSRVRIEVPLGSYVPEFILAEEALSKGEDGSEGATFSAVPSTASTPWFSLRSAVLIASGMAIFFAVTQFFPTPFYRRAAAQHVTIEDQLWAPMLQSSRPILIVVGTAHPDSIGAIPLNRSPEETGNPYHHVSEPSAIALAHLAGLLQNHGRTYQIKEPEETTLADIRARPLALVGASNNLWTMRLVASLPIHFEFTEAGAARIIDTREPKQTGWAIDRTKPYASAPADYAIVARFRDNMTEGPVIVIAGLGAFGTETAGEFVESPEYLNQLATALPKGWQDKNLELVIKTDVIDGKVGPPVLLTATTW